MRGLPSAKSPVASFTQLFKMFFLVLLGLKVGCGLERAHFPPTSLAGCAFMAFLFKQTFWCSSRGPETKSERNENIFCLDYSSSFFLSFRQMTCAGNFLGFFLFPARFAIKRVDCCPEKNVVHVFTFYDRIVKQTVLTVSCWPRVGTLGTLQFHFNFGGERLRSLPHFILIELNPKLGRQPSILQRFVVVYRDWGLLPWSLIRVLSCHS